MNDKWLFIVNSTAGNGKTGKNINSLVILLSKLGFDYQIELTKYQGHAIEIAASQAKSYRNIIAVGGDGTASEVVNGIIKSGCRDQVNFGIIPQGGGNDFCRLFHQTDNIENILIQYTKPVIQKIDVAAVEDFYFFNSLGIGFDAQVAAYANKITFLNGFPRYLLAVCLAMLKFKNFPLKILIDEQKVIEGNFLLLAIGNGKFAGGGFNLNPDALIDDGLLDIMLARDVDFLRIFTVLPMVLKGTHLSEREISYRRCRKLEVFSDVPVPIYCDGEIPLLKNPHHISINILHQAINFIYPTSQ